MHSRGQHVNEKGNLVSARMTEVEEHSNLEKVTDFVEEKELDNEETMNALSSLADPAQALMTDKDAR